jgi:hypothetical protein
MIGLGTNRASGTYILSNHDGGGTSRPASVLTALTSRSNSCSNVALSCSQVVKSAASRERTEQAGFTRFRYAVATHW